MELCKGTPLSVLIFAPKPFSPPSPLNPQPGSRKIHWSSVQNFKLHLLQVWTRFVKFGEIHSNLSPKILSKIRQPLGALSGHLTKSQPQEIFSHCQIILSNTCSALSKSGSVKFREHFSALSFSSEHDVDLASAAVSPCSLSPPPCPLHRTSAWKLADVGDEQQEVRRPVPDASGGFAAVRREAQRRRRRPAPPKPPEVAAWPSTPQNALPLSS